MSVYQAPKGFERSAQELTHRGVSVCQRKSRFHTQAASYAREDAERSRLHGNNITEKLARQALDHHLKDAAVWSLAAYFAHLEGRS